MWNRNRIKDQLDWAEKQLAKVGVSGGRHIGRNLLEYAVTPQGQIPEPYSLRHREEEKLDKGTIQKFKEAVFRRMRGEATSRITGYREFWSLNFKLNAATLDPRQDTESVIEGVLHYLAEKDPDFKNKNWKMLDLGTGSGCIIIALLHELRSARGFASDISPQALSAVAENAAMNHVSNRLSLFAGNWGDALQIAAEQDKFDVIVSNPPYIPEFYRGLLSEEVLHFDPPAALWGGALGLDAYVTIMPQIRTMLKKDGFAVLEMGADQADAIAQIVVDHHMQVVDVRRDLAGHARCLVLRLKD